MASGWLRAVAINLAIAGFFDVAVRDVLMSVAAFTLARLEEVRLKAVSYSFNSGVEHPRQQVA